MHSKVYYWLKYRAEFFFAKRPCGGPSKADLKDRMSRERYSEDNRSSLPSASQIRFRYSERRASSLNNDTSDILSLQRDSQLFSTSRDHFYDAVSVPLAIPGIGGRSSHTSLNHDLMKPREDSNDGIDVGDAIIALQEPLNGGRRAAEPPGPMVGMTFQLAMIALVIALGTSQLGFNISVINVYTWSNNCNVPIEEGVENECLVFHGHSTYEWSVVASIYAVGMYKYFRMFVKLSILLDESLAGLVTYCTICRYCRWDFWCADRCAPVRYLRQKTGHYTWHNFEYYRWINRGMFSHILLKLIVC